MLLGTPEQRCDLITITSKALRESVRSSCANPASSDPYKDVIQAVQRLEIFLVHVMTVSTG